MSDKRFTVQETPSPPVHFLRYVEHGKNLALQASLSWKIELDQDGVATAGSGWDLRKLLNDGNPAGAKLRSFCTFAKAIDEMKSRGIPTTIWTEGKTETVSENWQDLIKSYVLQQLLVAGYSIPHVSSTCTALRLMATVTNNKAPWQLTADDLELCLSVALSLQPSGQSAIVIRSFVKTVLDAHHLIDAAPISPLLRTGGLRQPGQFREAKYLKKKSELKTELEARKSEEKLPEMRAFWELMRIVFTEKPRTFYDAIRFAQGKLLTLTGLRIGEIALLPLDWRRTQNYHDRSGIPAGEHGGVSRALLLRYFAEKQGSSRKQVGNLWENTQFVPMIFETILSDTLLEVERLTAPLRRTLKAQCETGRLLPMYPEDSVISVAEMYMHMTGMVLTRDVPQSLSSPYFERYRNSYDLNELEVLINLQTDSLYKTRMALYQFVHRLQKDGMRFYTHGGAAYVFSGPSNAYLKVREVEAYIRAKTPTKVSDMTAFRLENGKVVQPWEMLFLLPKRALAEGRENIPCHVGKVLGVGVATPEILSLSLSADRIHAAPTLFETYGETELDRRQILLPHSLRHLQNTELFRLGIADTIITKRFNRRSVAQSYEYDHRSLQEELEQITLPDEWETYLGPKAGNVAKMIKAGRANGPLIKDFKRIQAAEGDDAAYLFLKAEADGFHATPYGHCINSFTVDPCPTHLECFNGCIHLSATDLPENRKNLIVLEKKFKDALELIRARESSSVGRENQIRHAEVRLSNIARLLVTAPGEQVFPAGQDLSLKAGPKSVLNGA